MAKEHNLLQKIKDLKPVLQSRFGINKLAIFGSYAKNLNSQNSDIDIIILDMKQKNLLTISKAQICPRSNRPRLKCIL